tara:strand:- start:438 stop:581 length:144 start_codon:yes stop_codon:yes gene_type:complete
MSGVDGWFLGSVVIILVAVIFDVVRIRKGRKKPGRIGGFGKIASGGK